MKTKLKKQSRGKIVAAVETLKVKMTTDAVKRHPTLEAAARELGLTDHSVRVILRRNGYRLRTKTVKTLELQGPN